MPNSNARNISAAEIWRIAQSAAPMEMAALLKELRNRDWVPPNALEKEWFDELSNLCTPLDLNAFSNDLGELIPIIAPWHNGGDFSLRVLSNNELLTHCPASSGLLQGWSIPHCRELFQHRLYSRRAVCELSRDGKFLAIKTEMDTIALHSLPDAKLIREWKHPLEGNSYRIFKFIDSGELLVTDRSNVIHFLSSTDNTVRSYPKLLFRELPLLDCSNDGRFLITPEHGRRLATIWAFPQAEKLLSFRADELAELRAAFSPNGKTVVLTSSIELQVRVYPFTEIVLQIPSGREISPPVVSFSQDNGVLAILRRTNRPELDFISLKTYKLLRKIYLPEFFSRHQITDIVFAPGNKELLLAGKETIYLINVAGSKSELSCDQLRKWANVKIRDFKVEDLQVLEHAFNDTWMSMYLRAWADMLIYLVKRRSYDMEISESGEQFSAYDMEIEG